MAYNNISLESALDEERRAVMDLLEGRQREPRVPIGGERKASPAPQIRSMLDVDAPTPPRHGSIAGIGVGVTSPNPVNTAPSIRSMLDPQSPLPTKSSQSTNTSPTATHPPSRELSRRSSDAATKPVQSPFRRSSDKVGADPEGDFQFEMLPSIPSQALPKRVTQGGKKQQPPLSSMAAAMSGELDKLGRLPRGRDSGRQSSSVSIHSKSKSPSSRMSGRSQSPGNKLLNTNSFNPMSTPGKYVTDRGKVIDLNSAYRRFSDAALLKSGGTLANMPSRAANRSQERLQSGEAVAPDGGVRLEKDYYEDEAGDRGAAESSDEDEEDESSDDEDWTAEKSRGRGRGRRKKGTASDDIDGNDREVAKSPLGMGKGKAAKGQQVRSLLGAAEQERESFQSHESLHSNFQIPIIWHVFASDWKICRSRGHFNIQGQIYARHRHAN